MKLKTTLRTMDDAIFQLQSVHQILSEAAHSAGSAKAVAELMGGPLDTLQDCLERLLDKVPS